MYEQMVEGEESKEERKEEDASQILFGTPEEPAATFDLV